MPKPDYRVSRGFTSELLKWTRAQRPPLYCTAITLSPRYVRLFWRLWTADGLSLTSDTVTKAYVRDVVGRERVRAESESNKTNSLLRDLLGDRYPRNRAGNKSSEARATPLRFKGDSPPCPSPISAPIQRRKLRLRCSPTLKNGSKRVGEGSDDKRTAPAATESAAETKLAALREQIAQKNREIENKRSDLANYEILKRNHEVQKGS